MSETVLKVENLSKVYRLGQVGTGTISHDLNRWWASIRGREDPYSKVGSVNDRTTKAQKGEYVKALSDINFEVKKGEVLGIIGKNGAGKSTLLKVISQITAPTTGSIKAKGRIASLLEVGTGMHPEMTGKENVYLNGTILGMTRKEIDAKFEEIMDFAGCAKYADTPVKRYSSGMKVRLGFAVAAFLEPEILIVDEVLAVGDAEFQKKAIGKMQDISSGGGRTVLFVSHNMGSVKRLCKSSMLLSHGVLKSIGETKKIIEEYIEEGIPSNSIVLFNKSDSEFIPIKASVFNKTKNQFSSTFNSSNSIEVQLEYEVKVEIRNLRISLAILSNDDQILFTFYSHYVEPTIKKPGVYTVKFEIPPDLFNSGTYKVRIHAGQPGIKVLMKPTVITKFEVEKIQFNTSNSATLPGFFAPNLKVYYE